MICTAHSGNKLKKNEMGGACSMYGGEERCIQGVRGETGRKETTLKTQARWDDNIKMYFQEVR
jgi:hypothetical protein